MFKMHVKTLVQLCEVNRKEEQVQGGYQRMLSEFRIRAIAGYVVKGNPLPLSLLISFDEGEYDENSNTLIVPARRNNAWVIDGQHRLFGCLTSDLNLELPVIAFLKLNVAEQIAQFVTINKEAKGVPSSLYLDLLKDLPHLEKKLSSKARAADIADSLRSDEKSSFLWHHCFHKVTKTR